MTTVVQYVLYMALLITLAVPFGAYIKKVIFGEKTFLSKLLKPCENLVYRIMRGDTMRSMGTELRRTKLDMLPRKGSIST